MSLLSHSAPIQKRSGALDRVGYVIAIGGGAGLAPFAPGTCGAIEGVGIYVAAAYLAPSLMALTRTELGALLLALNLLVFAVGVWASGRVCEMSGLKDPQKVVIDEVSGQLIALSPLLLSRSLAGLIIAFTLFRLFDIFKPYPIRKLEGLPGGFGVMADDALAGVYAGLLVWSAMRLHLI